MEREKLDNLVVQAFEARKGRSGAVGITLDLDEQGHAYNRKTVAASMKRQGLVAKAGNKYKSTTDSEHDLPVAPNRLGQDFSAGAPNQKWVCDITYLWTGEGWLYLAVVLDLFSRMVVGWAMDKRMKAKRVCDALQMALWRRKMPRGVMVYSDRGSQYCSKAYQALVSKHDLIPSMSGKGNCYDNVVAESFFHTLKVEMVHGESFPTWEAMRRAVFESIEVDYNRTRRHSANGHISPLAFETKMIAYPIVRCYWARSLAFIYPNQDNGDHGGYEHSAYLTSVDHFEELTGMDFFTALDDKLEDEFGWDSAEKVWH